MTKKVAEIKQRKLQVLFNIVAVAALTFLLSGWVILGMGALTKPVIKIFPSITITSVSYFYMLLMGCQLAKC